MPVMGRKFGIGSPAIQADPPIELTSLGEPNLPDPFRVDTGGGNDAPPPSSTGLYPEIVTAAPYSGAMYPPPPYGVHGHGHGPGHGHASPMMPSYVVDSPGELHTSKGGPYGTHEPVYRMPPWHTEQSTTIVVNQPQPPVIMSARPGPIEMVNAPDPVPIKCYNCEQHVVTYIYHESGTCTWLACIGLMSTGFTFGCCLIPFFISTCKDSVHKCPRCHVIIGKHRKIC